MRSGTQTCGTLGAASQHSRSPELSNWVSSCLCPGWSCTLPHLWSVPAQLQPSLHQEVPVFWKINRHHTRLKISQNITCNFLLFQQAPTQECSSLSLAVDFSRKALLSPDTGNFQYFSSSSVFLSSFFLSCLWLPTLCCPDNSQQCYSGSLGLATGLRAARLAPWAREQCLHNSLSTPLG